MFLTDDVATQSDTWDLLDQVVHAVQMPVIAAGGLATATDIARARRQGAAGVQVGTAYLCCDESTTSPVHRTALLADDAPNTALTRLFTGRPARGLSTG